MNLLVGLAAALACRAAALSAEAPVLIDGQATGRTFEGLGALSAGASSRLLMEYPEPQRSQILDLLFKPNYGASFQHLKVEIGGDVNSTDGTEPSYARTRQEFENPKPEYFERGYEWWLMKEARKRNPTISLDILQWGTPGWIGDKDFLDAGDPNQLEWKERVPRNKKKFYTQDNANYIAGFIQAAKTYHGVGINYCGIWNEMWCDYAWVKRLRNTLDARGMRQVQIVAADQTGKWEWTWDVAKEMLKDSSLMDAVSVVAAHYPSREDYNAKHLYDSGQEAKQTGKPLWSCEDGPWRGDWNGACYMAKTYNRNYIIGKMTKTIIWSLISSYYENLPIPNSGPMKAFMPWCGHYEVQPALWCIAHTTQFAQPGWKYLDSGCGLLNDNSGSYVSLKSPDGKDFSVILETVDAKVSQPLSFRLAGGLSASSLHLWRSTEKSQFDRMEDVAIRDNAFELTLEPGAIYSLTTTTGQQKAMGVNIPQAKKFPLPYEDNFDADQPGKMPRYFADQGGIFEVARRSDGQGNCVRQTVALRGIDWNGHPTPQPYTMIGSTKWRNYEASCEAMVEKGGYAAIYGRIVDSPLAEKPARGYWLKADTEGTWELKAFDKTIASGTVSFAADTWHKLKLRFIGPQITASIDNVELKTIEDATFGGGMAGLASGWNTAAFDNFSVQPISDPRWNNLAEGKTATASSKWDEAYDARFATDADVNTRWNSASGKTAGEWVEIDFGQPTTFNQTLIEQYEDRISKYRIQAWDGAEWQDVCGGNLKRGQRNLFSPVTASKVRLLVEKTIGGTPSIREFEIYNAADIE